MSRARCTPLAGVWLAAACRTAPAPELQQATDADDQLIGDVVDENEAKLVRVASQPEHDGAAVHFAGVTNESVPEFCARAERRLAELAEDHEALAGRAGADAGTDEDLGAARLALTEARADLEQVRTMSGPVLDDGRLGVSVAINRAQRHLLAARDGLTDARM